MAGSPPGSGGGGSSAARNQEEAEKSQLHVQKATPAAPRGRPPRARAGLAAVIRGSDAAPGASRRARRFPAAGGGSDVPDPKRGHRGIGAPRAAAEQSPPGARPLAGAKAGFQAALWFVRAAPGAATGLEGSSGSGRARGPRPTNGRNGSAEKEWGVESSARRRDRPRGWFPPALGRPHRRRRATSNRGRFVVTSRREGTEPGVSEPRRAQIAALESRVAPPANELLWAR
jgi:hypothetical protein